MSKTVKKIGALNLKTLIESDKLMSMIIILLQNLQLLLKVKFI